MRALLRSSALSLCLAWSLPQAGQAETVAQLLAGASERHGELFRADDFEGQLLFVDGLNEIWRLTDDGTLAARATAMVDQDVLHLLWQNGDGNSVEFSHEVNVTFTGELYPLAQQIKTIITDQLASATDNLPAGLRFDPDGTIFTAANRVFGNWSLQKENIVVSPSDGDPFHIPAAQLAAAMTPGANPNE